MAPRRSRSVARRSSSKTRKVGGSKKRSSSPRKSSRKMSGGSRKLNSYFKLMLKAKKGSKSSFKYNGKTYVGKSHPRLGMIYRSA
jgi:hypothetical protein